MGGARKAALASKLAAQLPIDLDAIDEAIRRGLLTFERHRKVMCWRFGDSRNGSFRRLDRNPFRIGTQVVKAEAETSGPSWHRLIGLDDVVETIAGIFCLYRKVVRIHSRRFILLQP